MNADGLEGREQEERGEEEEDDSEVEYENGGPVEENGGPVEETGSSRGEGVNKARRDPVPIDELLKFYSFQPPYDVNSPINFIASHRASAQSSGKVRVPSEEKCRSLAAERVRNGPERKREKEEAEKLQDAAEASFERKLREVCEQEGDDYTEMRMFFDNGGGVGAVYWNFWREMVWRDEFRTKLKTGVKPGASKGIRVDDPMCEVFCNFCNYSNPLKPRDSISIAEFICSDLVKRTRGIQQRNSSKAAQAGTCGYSTSAFHDQGVRPPVGRFARVGKEPVAEGGEDWVPFSRETMRKMQPVVKFFELWMIAKKNKKDKEAKFTTIERDYRVAMGNLGARPPEKARTGQKRNRNKEDPGGNARDRTIMSTHWHTLGLNSSVEEDIAMNEEFHALADIWQHLGLTNTGVFKACLDWGHHLVNMFFDTNALVLSCDKLYEPQDGSRFRDIDEHKSFMDGDMWVMVEDGMKEEHGNVGIDDNGHPVKTYSFADETYKMRPYAAVYNSYKQLLHVDFRTLHLYYPQLYKQVKRLLLDWNGNRLQYGFSPEEVLRRTQDLSDVIYSDTLKTVLAEPPPYLIRGDGAKRITNQTKLWRLRPPAPGEKMPWDAPVEDGDPEPTKYPLVAELRIEPTNPDEDTDWAMWCMGTFWQQDVGTKIWERCPQDELGHFHEVGWAPSQQSLNVAMCQLEPAGPEDEEV